MLGQRHVVLKNSRKLNTMKRGDREMSTGKRFMSIRAFASEYGVGLAQAYAAARKGEIPAVRIGKRLWIVRDALEMKLMESSTTPINSTT